jgi:hypothetical protein
LGEWERDGYGYDDVEVWVISQAGELAYVSAMMGSSDSSAFEDTDGSASSALLAFPFSLIILDRNNVKQASVSTLGELGVAMPGAVSLLDAAARADVDSTVRSLL